MIYTFTLPFESAIPWTIEAHAEHVNRNPLFATWYTVCLRLWSMEFQVIAFSGHMTDLPHTEPRFPESAVSHVRNAIEAQLRRFERVVGVSSAARGGDILFVESVLAAQGSAFVYLPFPASLFEATSVGDLWSDRFCRLLVHPSVVVRVPEQQSVPRTKEQRANAYAECNASIAAEAQRLSKNPPILLALLHRTSTSERGGTENFVDKWKGRKIVIDPLEA